jgi:hypothetical protein
MGGANKTLTAPRPKAGMQFSSQYVHDYQLVTGCCSLANSGHLSIAIAHFDDMRAT